MNKFTVQREIEALEATLPEPSPTAHMPYVASPQDLGRVMGRGVSFIIGPHYSLSARARESLADIERLGG
jgi:hypothetical protein